MSEKSGRKFEFNANHLEGMQLLVSENILTEEELSRFREFFLTTRTLPTYRTICGYLLIMFEAKVLKWQNNFLDNAHTIMVYRFNNKLESRLGTKFPLVVVYSNENKTISLERRKGIIIGDGVEA